MKENKLSKEDLEQISAFARKEMKEDEIYTFSLILCDNEIDRDKEKFTVESLEKLAKLFIGKTGIFDHNMSGKNQNARIYSAWVESDPTGKTADGEVYTCVKAKAYMVRTETNKDLIIALGAAMVNHRLCMRNFYSGDGVTSFKAGDVTVNSDTASLLIKAKEQLDFATENASSLIKDTTFSFKQVKI